MRTRINMLGLFGCDPVLGLLIVWFWLILFHLKKKKNNRAGLLEMGECGLVLSRLHPQ